ncbi:TetR/AcrR family transcriptional regulator [Rhizobium subbaraonis]|nr:TetR/AcrR family transcriptional regulator [Rhizobium subbaraonis]
MAIVEGSTPDIILKEAGRLFSLRGYHGTSTREIANAVGIRQPSLFHHFASKAVIAQHLLEYDRLRSPILQGHLGSISATPSVRMYQTIRAEILVELTSRYELRGLYLTDALDEEEFVFWKTEYDRAIANARLLIVEGMASGEFIAANPEIVARLFDAALMGVVRWNRGQTSDVDPDEMASLLMRSILARTDDLPAIRTAASKLSFD